MYYHTSKTRTSTQRRPRPKSGGHSCLELEIGVVGLGGWCSTHCVLWFGEEEAVVVDRLVKDGQAWGKEVNLCILNWIFIFSVTT
jgi:hypothetical protein